MGCCWTRLALFWLKSRGDLFASFWTRFGWTRFSFFLTDTNGMLLDTIGPFLVQISRRFVCFISRFSLFLTDTNGMLLDTIGPFLAQISRRFVCFSLDQIWLDTMFAFFDGYQVTNGMLLEAIGPFLAQTSWRFVCFILDQIKFDWVRF